MTPGAKFSAKTSAFSISPRRTARPLSVFRLAVTLFLLALSSMKYWESTPFLSVDAPRPCSPLVGSSTLITSAPSHPKVRVQDVPASNWVRSTTRTPCRAPRCAAVVWPIATGVRSSGMSFLLVVMHYRRARCRSYGPTLSLLRDVVNAFALSSQGSSYASSSVREGGAGKRQIDTTILRAALCGVVRGYRIRFAEALCRNEVGLHPLRDQKCHHAI